MHSRQQHQIDILQANHENFREISTDSRGVFYKVDERMYKFVSMQNNQQNMNQVENNLFVEFECLNFLSDSFYTSQILKNLCDIPQYLWIATMYMNQGNLDMDSIYLHHHGNIQQQIPIVKLSLQSIYIIVQKLLKILNYFHARRIYHLNVNPRKVLLHYEYQFQYRALNNQDMPNQDMPIQDELDQLRADLLQNHYNFGQFQPDYVSFQMILKEFFQNATEDQPRQLIQPPHRFNYPQTQQLIYWIEKWLRMEGRENFNRYNIYVVQGIKICFCDFEQALNQNIQGLEQQLDDENFYKTPYQILRNYLGDLQIDIQQILRQQDLFCLGQTMFYLLQINYYIELRVEELNKEEIFQFIRQRVNIQNLNQISYQDLQLLNRYYSQIKTIQNLMNAFDRAEQQNEGTYYLLNLIKEMLSFSFTPSVFFENLQEQPQVQNNFISEIIRLNDYRQLLEIIQI